MVAQTKLEREIGELAGLPREVLVERWNRIYRAPPPRGIRRGLIERAIAWHLQARALGGLSPSVQRRLKSLSNAVQAGLEERERHRSGEPDPNPAQSGIASSGDTAADVPGQQPVCTQSADWDAVLAGRRNRSARLAPGTRLIREWHGRSHCVDVTEEGFVFEGRTWQSLSAIARQITGARWSGPRFFGL